ncbi:MAG: hypothetical protein JWQ14_516 [Adhaeribacter sp.]|nr:hypothetical protein [Adhaeribacter sp.]
MILALPVWLLLACEARREPRITQPETTSITTSQDSIFFTGKPTDFIIRKRQIGPIKIDMPVSVLKNIIPSNLLQEVEITREGTGYKAYKIKKNATDAIPALRIEEVCEPTCRVWRVQVMDTTYRTPTGIGIGSTLGEVKKHYTLSYLGPGETEIVAVSEAGKITFMLDVSKLQPKQVPFLNLKNTPDKVPVLGILVF